MLLTLNDNSKSNCTFEAYGVHAIVQSWKEILEENHLLAWASQEKKRAHHTYARHVRSLLQPMLIQPFDTPILLDSQARFQELETI
jgi:hypothetical protein